MMKFNITFFNEQDAGRILGHFKLQGFSSSLVERVSKGGVFMSTYELTRARRVSS